MPWISDTPRPLLHSDEESARTVDEGSIDAARHHRYSAQAVEASAVHACESAGIFGNSAVSDLRSTPIGSSLLRSMGLPALTGHHLPRVQLLRSAAARQLRSLGLC